MDTTLQYSVCDVIRRTTSIVWGIEKTAETQVYFGIPCYVKNIYAEINIGTFQKEQKEKKRFIIDLGYAIQDGDIIVFEAKRYEVAEIKQYKLIQQGNISINTKRL